MTGKKGQSLKRPADDYSRRKQGFRRSNNNQGFAIFASFALFAILS